MVIEFSNECSCVCRMILFCPATMLFSYNNVVLFPPPSLIFHSLLTSPSPSLLPPPLLSSPPSPPLLPSSSPLLPPLLSSPLSPLPYFPPPPPSLILPSLLGPSHSQRCQVSQIRKLTSRKVCYKKSIRHRTPNNMSDSSRVDKIVFSEVMLL